MGWISICIYSRLQQEWQSGSFRHGVKNILMSKWLKITKNPPKEYFYISEKMFYSLTCREFAEQIYKSFPRLYIKHGATFSEVRLV